jgi:GPI mannosyltransferase 3
LNFLRVNLSSVSLFYGGNPWHYYLTQALPILLTTSLPSFLHGSYLTIRNNPNPPKSLHALRSLLGLIVWTLIIYSLAGHKEWRFIHPLLPVMHLFCTQSLLSIGQTIPNKKRVRSLLRKPAGFLILLPLPVILYTTFMHGRAQIAVIDYLRDLPREDLGSIGFLMPCHSTPWMAYLHRPELSAGRAWALGCEPPLG